MEKYHLYKDIQSRTNGEIYLGIVGPVRTGKSTFIKRFMDVLVLPHMDDEHGKMRTRDELPQSASGKTIMTTEPKFVPKEAAEIRLSEDTSMKIRLIDCVGYMVDGAYGHVENNEERQVKTPWFEYEIPFTKAAAIGTRKVIHEHATVGIVITTDGSIGEIERENYIDAEDKTIRELQSLGKPFVVILNAKRPYSEEARNIAESIRNKHGVQVLTANCEQLKEEDIHRIMEAVLYEFPISEIHFFVPRWVEMLPRNHKIKQDILLHIRRILDSMSEIKDAKAGVEYKESIYIEEMKIDRIEMDTGCVNIRIEVADKFYYEMLSELTGAKIEGQYDLIAQMKRLSSLKEDYERVKDAFDSVRMRGYGVVSPQKEDIVIDEPEVIKQGNKYGVKIHSKAPTIHLIRANIETEIAPIVGNEKQAEDLKLYIKEAEKTQDGVWGTNIFGKSVEELVMDGIQSKMSVINDESQVKLQDTMQKIVNESNGGLVLFII